MNTSYQPAFNVIHEEPRSQNKQNPKAMKPDNETLSKQ